jgi:acetolactate synthase-1/2/3 large subunit
MACPEETVIDIAGDGSIQMNIQELATAVNYGVPVIIAVLNNRYLGMVRQWQDMFYERKYAGVNLESADELGQDKKGGVYLPDFVKLAEAYGAAGMRVTKKEDVVPTIESAIKMKKVVLIDFMCTKEENVFPMVPAGKGLNEMIKGVVLV